MKPEGKYYQKNILKTFYSGAIESVLTQCISVWHGNTSNQNCKALQRVMRLAERISGSALPSLQDIYLKRCKCRAAKIIKNTNHPGNSFFHFTAIWQVLQEHYIYIYAFSRHFYPKRLTVHSGYTCFLYVCSLGIKPTTFALLTQCSNH